ILIVFSVPFISAFSYLNVTVFGDTIRFGVWGFCAEPGGCTPKTVGYIRDPEIIPWMTRALILFPISAGFSLICVFALLPSVMCHMGTDTLFPPPLYSLMAIPNAFASLTAFAFIMALSTVTKMRFQMEGFSASYGPLPWMSLAAMVLNVFLMLYTGCGATWRGPCGQMSPHIRNRWSTVYTY
ncbi:hypothetical protein BU17DRAFT_49481, partial [Hysterangium stoloniferum]